MSHDSGTGRGWTDFKPVFADELEAVLSRWRAVYGDEDRRRVLASEPLPSAQHGLVGLALSGGGTRSATFNLGAIQALHERGVFKHVDYLSTVSGGGYLGACLSSSMREAGSPFPFEEGVDDGGNRLVDWLRNVASRLTPSGLMNWLGILIAFARGLGHNVLLFVPFVLLLALFILLVHSVVGEVGAWRALLGGDLAEVPRWAAWTTFFLLVAILLAPTLAGLARGLRDELSQRPRRAIARWERTFTAKYVAPTILIAAMAASLGALPVLLARFRGMGYAGGALFATVVAVSLLIAVGCGIAALRASGVSQPVLLPAASLFGLLAPVTILLYITLVVAEALVYEEGIYGWVDGYVTLGSRAPAWIGVLLTAALVNLYVWLLVNPNRTSIHGLYADRLAAAYFDESTADDVLLQELSLPGSLAPYPIINTALNIQGTQKTSLRGRGTESFFFSPKWVGSEATRYCRTADLEEVAPDSTRLSTAMAVSGGVVSPQMGGYTLRALVPLLAMFNIRLGYWIPNPGRLSDWIAELGAGPRSTPGSVFKSTAGSRFRWRVRPSELYREMASRMSEEQKFVSVSDGGHVENTGIYELLRRRCRFIIAGDAEMDPEMTFEGLGTLIRRAKLDLGVTIDLLLDDVELGDLHLGDDPLSNRHCAFGTIRYPESSAPGLLLYYKLSLTGDEGTGISGYRARHEAFPHESTADLSFTEDQFEAYRNLGHHIIDSLFPATWSVGSFPEFKDWFVRLRDQLAPTRALEGLDERVDKLHNEIEVRLDHDLDLRFYYYELYPSEAMQTGAGSNEASSASVPVSQEQAIAARSVARRQLRLMYEVFKGLRLYDARYWDSPASVGWRREFMAWAGSATFRMNYEEMIGSYTSTFRAFCESALGLPRPVGGHPGPG